MARPIRCRRICFPPKYDSFAPCEGGDSSQVVLAVDEFETIRLMDVEKRTHEQCAKQMGVSRTTVTEMYEKAREKIADCIVNGKTLCISGGHYALCDGSQWERCGRMCSKVHDVDKYQAVRGKEAESMKVAVTYENANVFQHFGHTEQFKVFDIEGGKVIGSRIVDTDGSGHGSLAGLLLGLQVDTLICGGIGAGAQNALAEAGIRLYGGVSGSVDEAVDALLAGKLVYDPDVHCSHHGHGEGHHCGDGKQGCAGNGGHC